VVWWIVAIIVAAVFGYAIWTFNRLVGLSKRADAAWSDIDVQLKRRWDLVPALVETVKGYAHHESSTLERVVETRRQAVQPASIPERGSREQNLSAAVRRLFAVAEAYPDLKATHTRGSRNTFDAPRLKTSRLRTGEEFSSGCCLMRSSLDFPSDGARPSPACMPNRPTGTSLSTR
jgi:hypothetical protein